MKISSSEFAVLAQISISTSLIVRLQRLPAVDTSEEAMVAILRENS